MLDNVRYVNWYANERVPSTRRRHRPVRFAEVRRIEAVSAHHGDNHLLLVERFYRRDRAQMFATAAALDLEATSADRSVLDASTLTSGQ